MAGISTLADTKELGTSRWKEVIEQNSSTTYLSYNERVDVLTLLIVPPNTPKIVHYLDEHVAFLYGPETKQVIGLRIGSFERRFLPKYSDLKEVWKLGEVEIHLNDFGDLSIAVQQFEKKKPVVTYEISKIAHRIAEKSGLELTVPS